LQDQAAADADRLLQQHANLEADAAALLVLDVGVNLPAAAPAVDDGVPIAVPAAAVEQPAAAEERPDDPAGLPQVGFTFVLLG